MSSDEIFFDGVQYVSTSSAASLSNLTRDYIARLCREGKLVSRRVGKNWYISHPPLKSFLVEHAYSLDKQREELAQQRVMEYQAHVNSVKPSFDKTPESPKLKQIQNGSARHLSSRGEVSFVRKSSTNIREHIVSAFASRNTYLPIGLGDAALHLASNTAKALIPTSLELLHKVTALVVALSLTLGAYAMVDAKFARYAGESLMDVTRAMRNPISVISLSEDIKNQLATVALNPTGTFSGAMSQLARTFSSEVDRLVYSITFPDSLTGARDSISSGGSHFADADTRASVAVRIYPRALCNATSTPAETISGTKSTSDISSATQTTKGF